MLIEASFGTAAAFFNPASTGLVPRTVPEGEVQQAYAANSVVFNAAELVGPAIVAEEHYGSTGVYGAIATAMGAGTVIGSLAGLRWRPRHPIRFAMSWAALRPPAFALFALGPPVWAIIPLFVLVGFGFAMFDLSWDTAIAGPGRRGVRGTRGAGDARRVAAAAVGARTAAVSGGPGGGVRC